MDILFEPSTVSAVNSQNMASDSKDVCAFPSSLSQQRFWFLDQLEPGNPAYNIAVRWQLVGKIEPALLERAINGVLRRHEVLRTRFRERDALPLQVVVPSLEIPLPVFDLRSTAEADREKEAERITLEFARRRFDLETLPLIRVGLLQLAETDNVMLLTVHHAVADGWSIGLIAREMCLLYAALAGESAAAVPELPIQYADFALWQKEWLGSTEFEEHASYWRQHLLGVTPFELTPDLPRPDVQTSNGTILSVLLPKELTNTLQSYASGLGSTFFALAAAAFATLMYRYTGQEDIAVTTQVAGRNRVEIEDLVGLFINTVVLRLDLSGNPAFAELVERARKVILDAIAHQDMPFEQLVDFLKLKRDLRRKALFQVNFIYQRAFVENMEFAGNQFIDLPSRSPGALYDLNVFMVERVDGWRLSCEFNTDLYLPGTVARMLSHMQALFASIAANPRQTLQRLLFLPEEERQQLLAPGAATDYPRTATVHQLVELQAERTPDAVAVVFGNEKVTYRQLNVRANQLARYLHKCGIGPDSHVGICVERSVEMIVALLGVLKAGGAYVPLDPAYPRERLAYMLEDAQVRVLVTQSSLAGMVPAYHGRIVRLDEDGALISRQDVGNLPPGSADDLAYVIYTSGSTGRPKGVMIPHRAVVNLLCSVERRPGLTAQDKLLAITTLSFDIAGLELFLPLKTGAQIVLAPREAVADGQELLKLLKESGATVMQATPATWRLLIESGMLKIPHLKMLCGGEAWSEELATQLLERGAELWNMYGPTETTIWSSVDHVLPGQGAVVVGPPMDNTQFYVLDPLLQPVPAGVAGELLIGGDGLARGYWNREELSREKFIPNPFNPSAGRLYRTGDLVRRRPDGKFEFLGRLDHQTKIRGFRIELEEIQSVLTQHPHVRQALVVMHEVSTDDRRLFAYVVPEADSPLGEAVPLKIRLRNFMREKLPDYMLPSAICVLDRFPLTANGKIDRSALPSPDPGVHDPARTFAPPRDELESRLCKVWEDVLQTHPISIDDDFFDLGGHSLLAVKLFAAVRQMYGKNLPLVTLFRAPTVAKLATALRSEGAAGTWSSLVPIQVEGSRPPLYIISGLGGNVVRFRDLAKDLGPDQPVYALQPPGLDGKRPFLTTVEGMARHYISEIGSVQPANAPYCLAGYSFGGIVTFEMAQQLTAGGAEVGLVALLDAPEWTYLRTTWRGGGFKKTVERCKTRLRTVMFGPDRLGYLKARLRRRTSEALYRLYRALGRPLPQVYGSIEDINAFAAASYVPKRYPGKLTLFRTNPPQMQANYDALLGWGPLAGQGVEIYEIPGNHEDMTTEPNVRVLADRIRGCFEKVNTSAASR